MNCIRRKCFPSFSFPVHESTLDALIPIYHFSSRGSTERDGRILLIAVTVNPHCKQWRLKTLCTLSTGRILCWHSIILGPPILELITTGISGPMKSMVRPTDGSDQRTRSHGETQEVRGIRVAYRGATMGSGAQGRGARWHQYWLCCGIRGPWAKGSTAELRVCRVAFSLAQGRSRDPNEISREGAKRLRIPR